MNPIVAAAFAAASFGALPAAAQQAPWYLGLSAGESKTDSALVTNREATITGADNIRTAFDSKDTEANVDAYSIGVVWRF